MSEEEFYEGDVCGGIPHGKGKVYSKKGKLLFVGEIQYGKINGIGVRYYKNATYMGYFENGKFCGSGILMSKDRIVYKGNWKDDYFHGFGILYDKESNEEYAGEFYYGEPIDEN